MRDPLIQSEAFLRDLKIERLGCLSTDLIFGILNQGEVLPSFIIPGGDEQSFVRNGLISYSATAS